MVSKEKISKRILGFFSFIVGMFMAVASGHKDYNVESIVIFTVLGYSATLLGIDAYKHLQQK